MFASFGNAFFCHITRRARLLRGSLRAGCVTEGFLSLRLPEHERFSGARIGCTGLGSSGRLRAGWRVTSPIATASWSHPAVPHVLA